MIINQGDIYRILLEDPAELEMVVAHPCVVIQDHTLNHSSMTTVVVCPLTSNVKRVSLPGNVLLEPGEAGLPRQSVVEVAKVFTLEKLQLGDYIGTLSERRIEQILAGIGFIQRSFPVIHETEE